MKNKLVFIIAFFLFGMLLVVGNSCSKSDSYSPNNSNNNNNTATTKNISIVGMTYSPSFLTVAKGTVVKWTNNDGMPHTATSNDGSTFNSGTISPGGSYSYTANVAGSFNYHCTIHGLTMAGTLIVSP